MQRPANIAPFRVQIVCDTDLEYFRNIILGARQYSFETGKIVLGDRWLGYAQTNLPRLVRADRIDGIIAQVNDRLFESRLLKLGIPCVNISNAELTQRLPLVSQDDSGVGRIAATHLLECGCASFAFWGESGSAYSRERLEGFRECIARAGVRADVFQADSALPEKVGGPALIRKMSAWLKSLPRPVGIFTVLDSFGLHLLRAARQLGLRVPEDMAVLGAGDDEFWVACESIPLSSVQLPSRQIGFEAARRLSEALARGTMAAGVRLPVRELSARQSTDVRFTRDKAVQRAVAFIRENAMRRVRVDAVARACGLSAGALQLRMRASLGHCVLEEIHRARLRRVQFLLRTEDCKLTEIAQRCDFFDSASLCVFFKKRTGISPRQYRAQSQKEGGAFAK